MEAVYVSHAIGSGFRARCRSNTRLVTVAVPVDKNPYDRTAIDAVTLESRDRQRTNTNDFIGKDRPRPKEVWTSPNPVSAAVCPPGFARPQRMPQTIQHRSDDLMSHCCHKRRRPAPRAAIALLSGLLSMLGAGIAAAQTSAGPTPPAVVAPSAATVPAAPAAEPAEASHLVELPLQSLGGKEADELRGTEGLYSWPFGVRLDETVASASLLLRYTASPAMLPELSHLKIRLNGEVVATVPLPRENAGAETVREIPLDPGFFTDFNELTVQLVGHYSTDCEDPQHSSLWASISGKSLLRLHLRPLAQPPDLARLPAPFFDPHDSRRLQLPFAFAASPSLETLRAAGIVASWFGTIADYRSARFPVSLDGVPDGGHAVVFATNDAQPPGLVLPAVGRPTIFVMPHPRNPAFQLLVLQGKDDAQLQTAATALVLGQALLSGSRTTVADFTPGPPRPANDAPRWVRSDRPVKFGELVASAGDLQVQGHAPVPVSLNLRLAPDLFLWNAGGVPLNLIYRYTPPLQDDNSMLTVSMNDRIVRSFRLRPPSEGVGSLLPLAGGDARSERALSIPPFQLVADNRLDFQFAVDYQKPGPCRDSGRDLVRSAIDPDSTIDLSGLPHYAELPDLSRFANAGYPFTRYADLAETALVLPERETAADIEAGLFLLGRLGRLSGAPGTRSVWVRSNDIDKVEDRDLLIVGGGLGGSLLQDWKKSLPAVIDQTQRGSGALQRLRSFASAHDDSGAGWRLGLESQGDIAALAGFESPIENGRSVVAVLATPRSAQAAIFDALEDVGRLPLFRGDTVIVRAGAVEAYDSGSRYGVGSLPLGTALHYWLSRHPLIVALLGVIAATLLGFWLYWALRRAAARRVPGG